MADVKLNIKTAVDLEGVKQLKKNLEEVQKMLKSPDNALVGSFSAVEIQKTINAVNMLEHALDSAFDVNLNTINIDKFNKYLKNSNSSVQTLYKDLSRLGADGQKIFLGMTQATLNMGKSVQKTNKLVQEMKDTFMNTVRWGITSSLWNNITASVSKAFSYVKGLDKDLNDIRIVTGKSADQMERFAKQANKAAKELAVSTRDYVQGTLIYYQQGDDDATAQAKAAITAKASNVTGQDMSSVSEQLTAVWNGYQVANEAAEKGMQVYEEYVDKLAAVGATTASDLEEQATAMSKVASAASAMGVNFDQINAQIATVVSVTRQAPESVGNALKTIYARLGDLKVDGIDEFGVSLGEISGQLQVMGIEVLDTNGEMRDMGQVMTEVAEKWDTWTSAQKQAAAVAMAGKRQYNNLVALFENWDMYGESLETSMEATGTLSEQQNIALDSLESKMEQMKVSAEKFYDALFNEKSLGGFIEFLTGAIDLIASMTEGFGGLGTILPVVGGLLLKNFSGDIGRGIATKISNAKSLQREKQDDYAKDKLAKEYRDLDYLQLDKSNDSDTPSIVEKEQKRNISYYSDMLKFKQNMNEEELQEINHLMEISNLNSQKKIDLVKDIELEKEKGSILKEQQNTLLDIMKSDDSLKDKEANLYKVSEKMQKLKEMSEQILTKDNFRLTEGGLLDIQEEYQKNSNAIKDKANAMFIDKNVAERFSTEIQKIKFSGKETDKDIEKTIEKKYGSKMEKDELEALVKLVQERSNIEKRIRASVKTSFQGVGGNSGSLQDGKSFFAKIFKDAGLEAKEYHQYLDLIEKKLEEGALQGKLYGDIVREAIEEIGEESQETANKVAEIIKTEQEAVDVEEKMKGKIDAKEIEVGIQGIAEAIGTITSAIGTIRGFSSAISSAGDATVDFGERMKNSMMGFIGVFSSIPSVISGAKKTIDSFSKSSIGNLIAKAKGGEGATLSFGKSFKVLGIATLIATTAFAAISFGLANYAETLQQAVKRNEALTKEKAKVTAKMKEEKDALVTIDNELESLNEKYEEQEISLVELRSSIADTCLEYERQDLAMKALISDYSTLNGLIDEAKSDANKKYLEASEAEQEARVSTIASKLRQQAKGWQRDGNRIDIGTGRGQTSEMKETLEKYGIEISKGHVEIQDLAEAAAKNYDDLITDISKMTDKPARDLVALLTEIKPEVDEYKATQEERTKVQKEQTIYENTKDGIDSVEDYINALENIKEESKEFIEDETERAEWAKNELFKILKDDGKTSFAYAYEIVVNAKSDGEEIATETVSKVEEIVKNFNESEKGFLYLHLDLLKDVAIDEIETEIQKLISGKQDLINYNAANEFASQIEGIFNKKDRTEITEDEIDALFTNQDFINSLQGGLSQEEFEKLDYSSQLSILSDFYNQAGNLSEQYKEGALADEYEIQKARKEAYEKTAIPEREEALVKSNFKQFSAIDNANQESLETTFDSYLMDALYEEGEEESYEKTLYKLYKINKKENAGETLSNEEKKAIQVLKDSRINSGIFDEIDKLLETDTELKKLEQSLKETDAAIVAISKHSKDYAQAIQNSKISQDSWINSLDKLHGTYDSLTNVIGDYNEQGYITQDNLQTLLSLSSEELEYLEFENGQMTLNTDLMRANGLAMIENAKAKVMEELQNKLLAISQNDLAATGYKSTEVLNLETEQIKEATIAATQGQAAFDRLVISNAQLSGLDISLITEEQRKAAEQATEEARKKMLMLEEAGKNLFSSTRKVDKDDLLKIDEEIDRYWEINHALQEIEETMSDLKRTQDKLHGKELIQSLKAENKLIEEQTKAYEQLYKEQQLEEKDLREQLSHLGVDFYENGGIANYEEAMKAAMDRTNAALQDNTITDESRDRISKQYDKFVDLIKQYDELFTEKMNDTLNKIEENKLLELENNFKAWDTAIELELDLTEGKRQWEDFINEIDNDVKAVFSDLGGDLSAIVNKADLYSGDNGDIAINLKAMQDVMAEIDKLERGEDSDMFASISEGQKTLRELFDKTKASTLSLKDLFAEAWDVYLESIDQSAEKFDKVQEAYENINEQLEHEKELIELIYGTEAYDKISGIYQAQTYNSLSRIESLKTEVDLYQSLYDQAEEGTTEQLSYYEKLQEAQSELNNEATNYINLLKNDYANTINSILKNFETSITGGGTFDDLSEEWNRIQEKSDKYLDSVEGLYEIQKFANTIQDSISAETSLKNQQKLQALYDKELEYLREKENLTQYDLDAAEARYQITLKEIALEEARNSKDSMKLTRGADGNWSYQYVADEENMMNKQQELSDAYNNLYQLSKTAYESNLDSLMQLQNDFVTKSQEIASSQVLTEEQKKEKLEKLQQEYYEDYNLLAQENTLYRNDLEIAASLMLMDLRNQDENNYKAMTETEKGLTDDLRDYNINDYNDIYNASEDTYIKIRDNADKVMGETLTAWNDKAQLMANKWNGDGGESVKALVGNAVSQMGTAIDTLADKTRTGMETAGKEVENLGKNFGTATEEANKLKEKTEELAQTANNELATYKTQVDNIAASWATASSNVTAALTATEEYFKKLGEYDKDYNFDDNKGGVVTGDTKDVETGDKTTGGGGSKEHDLPEGSESITLYKDNQGKKADGVFNTKMADYYTAYDQGEYTYVSSSMAGLGSGWIKTSDAKTIENLKYSLAEKQIAERQIAENQKLLRNEGIQFYTDPLGGNSKNKVKGYHISYKDYTDMYGESAYAYWATVYDASNKEISSGWTNFNGRKPFSFDTGGYTGAWGSEGKLAVLHEKELVLNKTDTQNILNIVSMVRGLEQGIMGKISSMLAGLSGLNSNMYIPSITGDNNSSNNIFHITAEFPNADDVISIKEAILSLPNIASQYISENKK